MAYFRVAMNFYKMTPNKKLRMKTVERRQFFGIFSQETILTVERFHISRTNNPYYFILIKTSEL